MSASDCGQLHFYAPPMRAIGKKMRARRVALGLSQAALAKRSGITQTAISEIESGRTRGSAHIVEIARALSVDPTELKEDPKRQGDGRTANDNQVMEIDGAMFAKLPVYPIRFAAGAGAVNYEEQPIDQYLISMSMLQALTRAPISMIGIFQADGDSMEPTIYNRDWVFVDRARNRLTNPGIYCLLFNGDALIKRASQHLETGVVTLTSDNPKYGKQVIRKPADTLVVIGRVLLSIRRH